MKLHNDSILIKYFPGLTKNQVDKFNEFARLITAWNQKINLISRKDVGEIFTKHILHSLAIVKIVDFKPGTKILDIGTGGGFPGIPLTIIFPEVNFLLVDSIGKKIIALKDIVSRLDLGNVEARQLRAEEINEKFDFTVSRAVTSLSGLYAISHGILKKKSINTIPNGIISLKGGDLANEIKELKKPAEIFHISHYFPEEFFSAKKIVFIPCP